MYKMTVKIIAAQNLSRKAVMKIKLTNKNKILRLTSVHQMMRIVVEVVEVVVLVVVAATIPMRSDFLFSPWTNTKI